MNNQEFLPAQGRSIYLLAGIVHPLECGCLRGCGTQAKKILRVQTVSLLLQETRKGLAGCGSERWFGRSWSAGMVMAGPGSGGVNGGRRFALRPLRILSDLCDQKLLTAKVEKVRKGR